MQNLILAKRFTLFSFPCVGAVGCVALKITLYLTPPEHVFLVRKTIHTDRHPSSSAECSHSQPLALSPVAEYSVHRQSLAKDPVPDE